MKVKPLPSFDDLHNKFEYKDGLLLHKKTFGNRYAKGDIACKQYASKEGYRLISYGTKTYKAHRVIWKMMTGEDPDGIIDHINQNRADNRIENLRIASKSLNALNNSVNGCSFQKDKQKFRATIKINHKQIFLGLYDTFEEASARHHEFKQLYMEMLDA